MTLCYMGTSPKFCMCVHACMYVCMYVCTGASVKNFLLSLLYFVLHLFGCWENGRKLRGVN